ncbi:Putative chloroperoxidase [Septoria linicola]|uniref:Chloroperoxidase n=1 Tax=Septoria linicola TaxID=215465 RepID=A0A9Q9EPL4_9PEZI|nr:Putative chloroperoxidase [Septoria linicola]
MVQTRNVILSALPLAAAYPWAMEASSQIQKRAEPEPRQPLFLSERPNTSQPPVTFDAEEQFVDVSEATGHEFRSPGTGDIRGQCPGLNAAANHNYLPRNGIANTEQTTRGLAQAFGMSPDLAIFLAILSIAIAGDPVAGTWSIGGEYQPTVPLLTGRATGIAGTHNQYESDASIVRGDAYLNGGNVGVFQMRSWEHFYAMGEEYTLDMAAAQSDYVTRWSILNNPYYFSAPFAGLVAPAAHDFVINFMSNRSEENPGGVLNRDVLKQFFGVTGEPGSFVHNRGQERIPENWYRRSTLNAYNIPEVLNDVFVNNAMYPGIVRFGGNTGKVDSFAGFDITDLTGGAFNLASLAEGNNAACFFLQASMQGIPDIADPALGAAGSALNWATEQLAPLNSKLACPQLDRFNSAFFSKFPGASYKAEGQSGSGKGLLGGLLG